MKKIVIIGGGIAGLSAGIHAQQYGFESIIYEKNSNAGGQCTGWDRKGYHIDGCIHWLTGTKEGTELYDLWRNVGAIEQNELIQLDDFGTYEYQGSTVTLWKDLNRLKREMISLSPEDKEVIEELIHDIRVIETMEVSAKKPADMMSPIELLKYLNSLKDVGKVVKKTGKLSSAEYAERFKHPALKYLFSPSMADRYSAVVFAFSMGTFSSGNGAIPKGGSKQMALRMEKRYKELGGKIICNMPAEEIILNKDMAVGVRLSNGLTEKADYVIAACDVKYTFDTLLKGKYKDDRFEMRFHNPKDYWLPSSVLISYGVAEDLSNYPSSLIFHTEPYVVGTCHNNGVSIANYSYEKSFAPEGCTLVTSNINQSDQDYFYWEKLYENQEAYRNEKQRIADEVQTRIEKRYPELRGKITLLDVTTPMTYRRYTNAYHGAWMSFMMTQSSKPMSHNGKIKGIKNCYLTGQWLEPPGGLPTAAITGKYTAMRIAKKEKCLKI